MPKSKLPLRLTGLLSSAVLALSLSACALAPQFNEVEQEMSDTMGKESFQPATRSLRDGIETQDTLAQAAFWMREYELNPADLESAIKFSSAIRKLGNPKRAVEITQTTRALYPKDPYLAAEYAASLIASERAVEAIEPLDQALAYAPGYGRLWSLKGAALDQQEQYDLARQHYARALQITPNDPSVMANVGLSFALSGDPNTAEAWLRRAAAIPGASKSVKQNLALVLQIQGKTEEAEKMARLAQQQSTTRLPNLNPQPAQTLRGSIPSAPSPQPQAQYRPPTGQSGYQTHSGFQTPAPRVTVNNSPTLAGQAPVQAATPAYSQARSASDAARLAAQNSGQRVQNQVLSPEQVKQQEALLAKLANNAAGATKPQVAPSSQQGAYYPGRTQPVQAAPQQAASQAYYSPQMPTAERRGAQRIRR